MPAEASGTLKITQIDHYLYGRHMQGNFDRRYFTSPGEKLRMEWKDFGRPEVERPGRETVHFIERPWSREWEQRELRKGPPWVQELLHAWTAHAQTQNAEQSREQSWNAAARYPVATPYSSNLSHAYHSSSAPGSDGLSATPRASTQRR
jgi:hypothetical protein